MAITNIEVKDAGEVYEFLGLSTDEKGTTYVIGGVTYNMNNGSIFYEVDTGVSFIYDKGNINSETANNWWEIV